MSNKRERLLVVIASILIVIFLISACIFGVFIAVPSISGSGKCYMIGNYTHPLHPIGITIPDIVCVSNWEVYFTWDDR